MFLRKYFAINFIFSEVWGWIVHDNFSLIQVNDKLQIRSISHCVDISYVFLYQIFRLFIFIDAIKTVTCLSHMQIYNNFIFRWHLKTINVSSLRHNNVNIALAIYVIKPLKAIYQ